MDKCNLKEIINKDFISFLVICIYVYIDRERRSGLFVFIYVTGCYSFFS